MAKSGRTGDFCVTIGSGQGKAIMLVEPIIATYAPGGSSEPRSVRQYEFATEAGFQALTFADTGEAEVRDGP